MAFSRQHYETVAALLKIQRPDPEDGNDARAQGARDEWASIVGSLVAAFKVDNLRFDEERFGEACGYTSEYFDSWGRIIR